MNIKGIIISKMEVADKIAEALSPDNAGYMKCSAEGNTVKAVVEGTSPRTVLATVDDYLMNLSIAWRVHESANTKTTKK